MRTLYLHIGMPKAGSTSIQSGMRDARERLEAQGVSYLRYGRNHSGVFRFLVGQSRKAGRKPISKISLDELGLVAPDRAVLADRVREIARASCDTAVVSGEGFFGFSPEEVAAVKAVLAPQFDRVRVVAYLRDPISWASSRAQQAVKTGRSTEDELIEDLERRGRGALIVAGYGHLRSYVEAFGRDAVICRQFDRSAFVGGDLISDFLATIGRADLAGLVQSRVSNPSLSQEAVQLLCAFQARRDRENRFEPVVAERLRRRLAAIPGRNYALPPAVLQTVYECVRGDLDWLKREFGLELTQGGPRFPEARHTMDPRTVDGIADLVIGLVRRPVVKTKPNAKGSKPKLRAGILTRLVRKLGLSRKTREAKPK